MRILDSRVRCCATRIERCQRMKIIEHVDTFFTTFQCSLLREVCSLVCCSRTFRRSSRCHVHPTHSDGPIMWTKSKYARRELVLRLKPRTPAIWIDRSTLGYLKRPSLQQQPWTSTPVRPGSLNVGLEMCKCRTSPRYRNLSVQEKAALL